MRKLAIVVLCVLSLVFSVVPAYAQSVQELEEELLGTVSAKYESNGDPGLISSGSGDLGGASYGAYQFASTYNIPHTFAKWCISSGYGKSVGEQLIKAYEKDGNKLGTNFNTAWKEIAEKDAAGFLKLQRLYVKAKYYDPAVDALKSNFELDISLYGIAFKNAVWSRTLQHGLGSYTNITGFLGILRRVNEAIPGGIFTLSEDALITAIYEESGALTNSGTNPMLSEKAGGNAWIIRTYNLEGKYMKYYSGNSAAVQAGVYLRLRVNEIKQLLEMHAKYGGYVSGSQGTISPYLKDNQLVLTQCDSLTGIYASATVALSITSTDKTEGKAALNLVPISNEEPLSFTLKGKTLINYSGFSSFRFSLYLPNGNWGDSAKLTVNGVVNQKKTLLGSTLFSSCKAGWQTVELSIPKNFTAQWLQFELDGVSADIIGKRIGIDYVHAVSSNQEFEKYSVDADALNCRTGPATSYDSMGMFSDNTIVTVLAQQNGWYLCSGIDQNNTVLLGWCSGDYLKQVVVQYSRGDVNGDTKVDAKDALSILQYAVGKRKFTAPQKTCADVNNDSKIDAKDALQVLKIAVNKE